jgi:hypothetical protein
VSHDQNVGEPELGGSQQLRKSLRDTSSGQAVFISLWILGTLATLGALGVAYFFGNLLGSQNLVEPEVDIVEVIEPAPEFPNLTLGPRGPGTWSFDELRGGECVLGYAGAFAAQYSVVPCASPHDAELVRAILVSSTPGEPFPGEEAMMASARELCSIDGLVNMAIAEGYSDLVLEFSYPVTEAAWDAGGRVVYCFVSRAQGGTLIGSLAN